MRRAMIGCGAAALLLCGLAAAEDRDLQMNGPLMNGTDLGRPRTLLYANLREGVKLADGKLVRGVKASGTGLHAPGAASTSFTGAELAGLASDWAPVTLRIDEVKAAPADDAGGRGAGLLFYRVSYRKGDGWAPI